MTSSLFQEALADAKQLKEVAEQNAKNAIIDAVTPKIRKFIEEQLLESASNATDEETDLMPGATSEDDIDLTTDGGEPIDASAGQGLAERVSLLRTMSKIAESLTPAESAALIPIVEKMRNAAVKKSGSAGISRAAPSDVRFTHIIKENTAMQDKKKMYEVDLDELMSDEMGPEGGMNMGAEDEGMGYEDEAMDDEMADLYESLSALLEKEGDDEEEEEEEEEGEGAEDEDEDMPVEPTGEDEDEDGSGGGGVDTTPADGGDVAAGIEKLEEEIGELKGEIGDLTGMVKQLMSMQGGGASAPDDMPPAPAGGEKPPGAEMPPSPSERVYKVDEAALLRELRALREGAKGFEKPAKKIKGALPEASEEDERMADDEMSDLYEEMDDEAMDEMTSGAMPAHSKGHGFNKNTSGAFNTPAKKAMKENRDLKVSLVKHAEAVDSLRGQLTEMNLFNAKLLYVNRLLQDRELSDAQRRNIIESLDRARSLREVKLLYKGLSESIGRKTMSNKRPESVNESVGSRAVSPTSRPLATSGVRLNEAVEVHRWAVLAGIGSKA
jgi:hypothetical protein